jgi:xylulokinase
MKLAELLDGCFSVQHSPIWADSSTHEECALLEEFAGGAQVRTPAACKRAKGLDIQQMAELTGSRAFHRFTGPQIMALLKRNPDMYYNTCHISLVSSFITTLLTGE